MAAKNVRLVCGGLWVSIVILSAGCAKGGVETTVTLGNGPQGGCVVTAKEDTINTKRDKKVTWDIDRQGCDDPNEPVTVGNFRLSESSTAVNCLQATEGDGVTWPFKEDQGDLKRRQGVQKIELHVKTQDDLGGGQLTYYFDVCTGPNGEKKSDPRLVIEPS